MGRKTLVFGEKEWLEKFGKRFERLRKYLKLSQAEMGKKLGVTPQRISQIENGNGKHPMSITLFYEVCRVYRIDANYLLGFRKLKKKE